MIVLIHKVSNGKLLLPFTSAEPQWFTIILDCSLLVKEVRSDAKFKSIKEINLCGNTSIIRICVSDNLYTSLPLEITIRNGKVILLSGQSSGNQPIQETYEEKLKKLTKSSLTTKKTNNLMDKKERKITPMVAMKPLFEFNKGIGFDANYSNFLWINDNKIIFSCGSVIIIMNLLDNRQTPLYGHTSVISSLTLNKTRSLLISAQEGSSLVCHFYYFSKNNLNVRYDFGILPHTIMFIS